MDYPANGRKQRAVESFMWAIAGLLWASGAAAHNPDTSYARFRIVADEYSASFVYDVTSLVMIDPELDADADRSLSPTELRAAVPRIEAFLRQSIPLEIDGKTATLGPLAAVAWPAEAGPTIAEKDYHAPTALVAFSFVKSLEAPPADVWVRLDLFGALGGHHTVLGSIAHEGREEPVIFTESEPDYLFETTFSAEPPAGEPLAATEPTVAAMPAVPSAPTSAGLSATSGRRSSAETVWTRLWRFFVLGVEHILIGYDHILFLLALIVVSRPREWVGLVTAFTVAHSITLALATLGWVELPANLVEIAIAATIVFTAVENFWITDTAGRWKTTFAFGLIHGFGFAGVLRDLGLPTDGFLRALLAFNLGVEAGQLAIVAILAWPAMQLTRWKHGSMARRVLSGVTALCGLGWFLDRTFDLELMPF